MPRAGDLADREPVCNVVFTDAGWSSSVARWAHNPEVAGSNPVPATTGRSRRDSLRDLLFSREQLPTLLWAPLICPAASSVWPARPRHRTSWGLPPPVFSFTGFSGRFREYGRDALPPGSGSCPGRMIGYGRARRHPPRTFRWADSANKILATTWLTASRWLYAMLPRPNILRYTASEKNCPTDAFGALMARISNYIGGIRCGRPGSRRCVSGGPGRPVRGGRFRWGVAVRTWKQCCRKRSRRERAAQRGRPHRCTAATRADLLDGLSRTGG